MDRLTLTEVARALGLNRSTVLRHVQSGKLRARQEPAPFGPADYYWVIDRADFEAFAAKPRPKGNPAWRKAS